MGSVDRLFELRRFTKDVIGVFFGSGAIRKRGQPPKRVGGSTAFFVVSQIYVWRSGNASRAHVVASLTEPIQRIIRIRGHDAARVGPLGNQTKSVVLITNGRLVRFGRFCREHPPQIVVGVIACLNPLGNLKKSIGRRIAEVCLLREGIAVRNVRLEDLRRPSQTVRLPFGHLPGGVRDDDCVSRVSVFLVV